MAVTAFVMHPEIISRITMGEKEIFAALRNRMQTLPVFPGSFPFERMAGHAGSHSPFFAVKLLKFGNMRGGITAAVFKFARFPCLTAAVNTHDRIILRICQCQRSVSFLSCKSTHFNAEP